MPNGRFANLLVFEAQARSPHLFEQPYRLHDPIKALRSAVLTTYGTFRDCGAYLGMDRDHWVEILRCPICRKTGEAQLSAVDEDWLITRVESAPAGFKVIQLKNGFDFFCASCGNLVEP
jgi:hypothetical protein